ncbi:unnamed protein product [Blepharisma stoltei]|uniref:Uncharacterized protein n=1 Tax=Blepharisma stoltei TaxID=1481888 RepID=A0AAU9KG54_9CILI|nr:unnamed protein product [Blepharisma stoltei]
MHRNEQITSRYKEKILSSYLKETMIAEEKIKSDELLMGSIILPKQALFRNISNKLFTRICLTNERIDYCKDLLLLIGLINSITIRNHEKCSQSLYQPIAEPDNQLLWKLAKSKTLGKSVMISKKDIELSKIKRLIREINSCNDAAFIEVSILNKTSFICQSDLLALIPDYLTPELQELLYKIILLSKESGTVSLAASNAATILNRSSFTWKNLDLSGIKIPFADLSRGLFINVNFENSDLQGVNFQQSSIEFANFNGCNLSDISFDEILHIKAAMFGIISYLSFSACGKYLGFMDSKFNIWSVDDQKEVNKFGKILKQVLSFSFSNVGSYIAMCIKSHIQIRDIESEKIIHKLKGKFDFVLFSPSNAYLFAMSKNTAYFWNPETFELLSKLDNWAVQREFIRFSRNSKYIAGYYGWVITIWEVATKRKIDLAWPFNNYLGLSFFPNERYLSITSDNRAELWDFNHQGRLMKLNICSDIKQINFSPCGKFALLLCLSQKLKIWDIESNEQIELFEKCMSKHELIAISQCGKWIALSRFDSLIKVVKVPDKSRIRPSNFTLGVSCVSLSGSGRYLATGHFNYKIKVWDMKNFALIGSFGELEDSSQTNVLSITFSPSEKYLAFEMSRKIYIYDIFTKQKLDIVNPTIYLQVLSMAISYCGKYIAYAESSGFCWIYDFVNSDIFRTFETGQCMRSKVLFSPCQRYLAYSYKNSVRLWSFENQIFTSFEAFDAAFDFSPCKQFLAILSTGYSIQIWELNNFEKTSEIKLHDIDSYIFSFTYSPSGKYMICYHKYSRTEEKIILSIWNSQTKKQITHFDSHSKFYGKALNMYDVYSDNNYLACAGSYFVCAGNDGAIKIWNLDTITRGLPLELSLEHILNFGNMHVFNCSFLDAIISEKALKSILGLPYHYFIDRIK